MPNGSILVVDDDEAYLWYVDEVVKTAGLTPTLCTSAYAAKKALAEGRFELVIADLMLPGSSGLEVIELARTSDPLCVGVIMTAFSSVEAGLAAIQKGAYDFLVKPCPAEVLLASVHRALEHGLMKRDLARRSEGWAALKGELAGTITALADVAAGLESLPAAPAEASELARKAAALREGAALIKSRLEGLN